MADPNPFEVYGSYVYGGSEERAFWREEIHGGDDWRSQNDEDAARLRAALYDPSLRQVAISDVSRTDDTPDKQGGQDDDGVASEEDGFELGRAESPNVGFELEQDDDGFVADDSTEDLSN